MTRPATTRPSRRAPWSDLRFVLGILLIGASVGGVWMVIASARQTTPVYIAAHVLAAGAPVEATDLLLVEVSLGQSVGAYLVPDELEAGSIATRTINEGELVPASAIGSASAAATTSVVLRSADVPASVEKGARVEIWAAPLIERGRYEDPRVLVVDATVISVTRDDSLLGGGAAGLEVAIPRTEIGATLAAVAEEAALSIVPTFGGD
ncbi:SAF domain-containing protein [Microbacterium sp. SLBN-146]|uniref:SAF domain-containing protein n=1 Tax=Microbacterium sp. SLBN-146 TaxID=2768457 RepID=UPI00114F7455|nr:SAF domain-containing protein [Microbacterium sp. SLBN-146]